ncbi:MAG: (2Fe-2S) ferredoxin domain-containing protein [Chloroflexota bacterium]|nr:(2Fe-2S) ferredoxin domain-containing protein [Chloroflexota bacterium]
MHTTKYRAYVCCGRNCGPKGSGELLDLLEEEVRRALLEEQVQVLPTGCQAHCESGPTMVVYPGPIYYQEISKDKLPRIVKEHFSEGVPVADFFWTGPTGLIRDQKRAAFNAVQSQVRPNQGSRTGESKRPKRSYEDVDDFKW